MVTGSFVIVEKDRIRIGPAVKLQKRADITININPVEQVQSTTHLGMSLSTSLKTEPKVLERCQKGILKALAP